MAVRKARESDLAALNDIYNHYVMTSHATFDLEPRSLAWRQEWFRAHDGAARHHVLVAEDDEGLAGFVSSGPFRDRAAYATSVETSVYLAPHAVGKGVGRALYRGILPILAAEGTHRVYAGIALPNDASVRLHETLGFRKVARFSEQGHKFGRYWDVAWFELKLEN